MSFLKERRLPSCAVNPARDLLLKNGSEEATIKGFFRCVQWGSQHKSRKPHNSLETISLSLQFPFLSVRFFSSFFQRKKKKIKKLKFFGARWKSAPAVTVREHLRECRMSGNLIPTVIAEKSAQVRMEKESDALRPFWEQSFFLPLGKRGKHDKPEI